jgi:uncharacterized membrane protein YkoI
MVGSSALHGDTLGFPRSVEQQKERGNKMHMTLGKRIYWAIALVALLALAGSAVTVTSRLASAGGTDPTPAVQPCDQQDEADDAAEATTNEADTDNIEQECGDQNEANDAAGEVEENEAQVPAGQIDDGKDLLPQAGITLDQAIAAAQSAASGPLGEVDLEHYQGKLVFNVDVGDKDVKVDAQTGAVLSADSTD